MKEKIHTIIALVIAIVLSIGIMYAVVVLFQDTQKVNAIVDLINKSNQQQQAQSPVPAK